MSHPKETVSNDLVALSWLIRLRWAGTAAQLLLVIALVYWLIPGLNAVALFTIVLIGLISNVVAQVFARNDLSSPSVWLKGLLCLDIAVLTALLYFSGGSSNPFSTLYLTQVTIAAVLLRTPWASLLGVLACLCYGLLFYYFVPIGMDHHAHDPSGSGYDLHLRGMWISFLLVAASTVFFVTRVRNDLARKESEIAGLRLLETHQQKLAALATLSAGAAHELSTPLTTVGIIISEAANQLNSLNSNHETREDLLIARQEIARCKQILQSMSGQFNDFANGEILDTTCTTLKKNIQAMFCADKRIQFTWTNSDNGPLAIYESGLLRSIETLVDNAIAVTGPSGIVKVSGDFAPSSFRITVQNSGPPIPPELLSRLGEPFFTTKEPGDGMGLGLFLVRLFCQRHGGTFSLTSCDKRGTEAVIILPTNAGLYARAA